MRKYYIFILLILAGRLATAQTIYTHDVSGNRIKRAHTPALPVTLISFTAAKQEIAALLTWQTASETNSDRFNVERSQDGKKWAHIGSVAAGGDKTSDSWYSFTDKSPADGENLYRLKMIDKDETFAYSRIQSLDFGSEIAFFPNPVKDWLKIRGAFGGNVQLLNISGKIVLEPGVISSEGIDVSGLPAGIYLVRVLMLKGAILTGKIFKH